MSVTTETTMSLTSLLKQHQRVDEPADEKLLLQEALAVLEEYGEQPEAWMKWEDFEAELDRAEAAGELPDMSREEEAEFWKTHDATDFLADHEPITISRGKRNTQYEIGNTQ